MSAFDKVCNAENLQSALRLANTYNLDISEYAKTDTDVTYKLVDPTNNLEYELLDYCVDCKHALVDTSCCDNCAVLEEMHFNQSDS